MKQPKDTLLRYRFSPMVEGFERNGFLKNQYFKPEDCLDPVPPYILRIREIRKERHLTQNDVAQITFTSQKQYSRWESGQSEMPLYVLSVLALYFNVSYDFLLGFSFDKSPVFSREERRRRIKAMGITPYFNRYDWWFKDEYGNIEPEYQEFYNEVILPRRQ